MSEVRFFYIPVLSREPKPATGATGIAPSATLSWRAGREAVLHEVYLGTDPNALTLTDTATTNSYAPFNLSLGTTYYWRIDEVNAATSPTTWTGDVWSFSTVDYLVVDNMESYTEVPDNEVFTTWADGFTASGVASPTNGALVGYDDNTSGHTNYMERTTRHGGAQAMPFRYGQPPGTAPTSEATRTFATAQDWTVSGITTLTLWFWGDPNNAIGPLYVKVNNTKVVYNGNAGDIARRRWNQWNVDLTAVPASVLKSVTKLTIGVSGTGSGTLFIDDIRLYRSAPAIVAAVNPGTTGLLAYYAFSNNVQDGSGNGYNGTLVGAPTYVPGPAAFGTAMQFNGTTDAVDLGNKPVFNPDGSLSVSLWANIGTWNTSWVHVMVSNRGEPAAGPGWAVRRYSNNSLCWTTRGTDATMDTASATAMQLNEWIHIVCVFDQAAAKKYIYINGLLDATANTTAGTKITASTHNTYIGARATTDNTGKEAFFTGKLDEVRIWTRALTAGEAQFLSNPTP